MTETSQLYMFDDKSATSTSAPPRKQPQATVVHWLLFLLLAGSVLRLGLWVVYEPVAYPDTGTYMRPAQNILARDFSTYDGRRPPGYPLVLAIAGLSPDVTWALQIAHGFGNLRPPLLCRLCAHSSPGLCRLSRDDVQPEPFSTVLRGKPHLRDNDDASPLPGSPRCSLSATSVIRDKGRVWPWLLLLGLLAAFATLARPQFIFLPLLIATLIGYASHTRAGARAWRSAGCAGLVFLTSIVPILGWCWFNYAKVGFFTISTQTGLVLMDHTLAFIELAPERYATIRDIYLPHRDEKLASTGRHNASLGGSAGSHGRDGSLAARHFEPAHANVHRDVCATSTSLR